MFTPHTDKDVEAMLKSIGAKSVEELFVSVPAEHRFPDLNLPPAATEMEIMGELDELASANGTSQNMLCFLGAGAYDHYSPAVIDMLLRRGEIYTAYTPYQPEISQGTLQTIFEYQSMMAKLTGMDICNASHYDGATACAEAVILAKEHFRGKRKQMLVSRAVNPQYREVMRTYMQGFPEIKFIGDDEQTGIAPDMKNLMAKIDNNTALVLVQYPDFFGRVIDYTELCEAAHAQGALVCIAMNPTALGILKAPGDMGADIVVGEGQPLGIPLSYGGPYLGIFGVKQPLLRKISGRLVGETTDVRGQKAYVLTLTAREQHIRREKATSNICTNQGLMTTCAAIYMSLLGKEGFKQVSKLCYQKAHYTQKELTKLKGYEAMFAETPFFHEFVVKTPMDVEDLLAHLEEYDILGGYDLGKDYPELKGCLMIAVTEKMSKEAIDYFVQSVEEVTHD